MTVDYQIAVPSYQRASSITARTLAFLAEQRVERERVTVWVADEQELADYRAQLDRSWHVAVSAPGLIQSRCSYHSAYPPGTPLLNIDDDVRGLLASDGKKLHPLGGTLDDLVGQGFNLAAANGVTLWGVNGAANAMFLKPQVTVGLRYIIGAMFGSFAGDGLFTLANRSGQSSGEDFEATLMAFTRDGAVLRFDGVSIKTDYFAAGGIDAELKRQGVPDRGTEHARALEAIAKRYPGLARTYTKAGGVANIRLKPVTAHRLSWVEPPATHP